MAESGDGYAVEGGSATRGDGLADQVRFGTSVKGFTENATVESSRYLIVF